MMEVKMKHIWVEVIKVGYFFYVENEFEKKVTP